MSDFEFNRLLIVESLTERDFPSGSQLRDRLNGMSGDFPAGLSIEFTTVLSVVDFLSLIDEEVVRATGGDYPILHIEVHGREDKKGLVFSDGSFLDWSGLADALRKLNKATGFNLLIAVAACFGGYSLGMVKPGAPAPCCALIGPSDKIYGDELLGNFSAFYSEFLKNLHGETAIAALKKNVLTAGRFETVSAPDWFFRIIKDYLLNHCTRDRLLERSRVIQRSYKANKASVTQKVMLDIISKRNDKVVTEYYRTFFMLDDIPSNAHRYLHSLLSTLDKTNNFLEQQSKL